MIVKVRIKKSHKKKAGTAGVMDELDLTTPLTQNELLAGVVCAQLNKQYQVDFFSPQDYAVVEQDGEVIVYPKEAIPNG